MKKSFSSNKTPKKNRGVAVIFTLGILGLLTVMALGFASTALLNRKIADNTSSAEYAQHIAKNIALARAQWVVRSNLIADSVYSSGAISGEPTEQDFLHRMDTVLDGVELYRVTNDSGTIKIQDGTARWQYVKDSSGKLLGRYAYAIVPDSGHLDPVGNRGQTSVNGRYGFSEKEIGVYSLSDGSTGLNGNADSVGTVKLRSFKEFSSAFSALSSDNKKNFLKGGYRIQLAPTPDAFWIDNNQDGKKTKDELYLRFNMPKDETGWNTMTVSQLIGDGAGESDSDIKYTSTTQNSVGFIPWLKYWTHSHGAWTADLMKKQIAANIIQYNRPHPTAIDPSTSKHYPTVSDVSGDWLTTAPTYAGIGRHPMLNEVGLMVQVKADVSAVQVSEDPKRFKYEPSYKIVFASGVELINPFSSAPTTKCHVRFSNDMEINIMVRSFKEDLSGVAISSDDDLKKLFYEKESSGFFGLTQKLKLLGLQIKPNQVSQKLKQITTSLFSGDRDPDDAGDPTNIEEGLTNELSAVLSREFLTTDWSDKGYTKADKFWKEHTCVIRFKEFTLDGDDYSAKIKQRMRFYQARIKLGNAVLYYGDDSSETTNQRDFAKLSEKTVNTSGTNAIIKFIHLSWSDLWSNADGGKEISDKSWLGFCSTEAADPLVNHYGADWATIKTEDSDCDETDPQDDINKKYPGTVFNKSDGGSGSDSHHLNSAAKDSSGNPVPLLKDTENSVEVSLESATDPAGTSTSRLSSSYIRHAPMRSLWELGFISRAEAFKTLNLGRTRIFNAGTAYNARGGGTFEQGDANLLDQVKFSDTDNLKDAQGKININARYHQVFEWIFNKDTASSTGTTVNWFKTLISGSGTNPYETTAVEGTTQNVVCSQTSSCLSQQHSDSCTVSCLAHLLMERSRILPFGNRTDLLLDPDYPNSTSPDITKIPGYSNLSSTNKAKLKTLQRKVRNYLLNPGNENTNEAKSKLVREQYAARFMNLLKADSDEHVYIIVVAQSIKDVGGAPAFVDWNGDGEFTPVGGSMPTYQTTAKFIKTGFVRKKLDGTNSYETISPSSGTAPTLTETLTTTAAGTYDFGADKITGESKLVAEMVKDEYTGKWKMIGLRYVE